jgi:formamidase
MGSIGSVSKPTEGLLVGLVQYPVPVVNSRADIDKQVEQICKFVRSTKAGYPGMELVVMPE